MNHTSEHVLAFSDELRQILSVLSEHLNLHVRNADLIHKGTMDLIERLLTASEAIDEKYRELNMAPGNPMSPVEYGAKGGFYRRYEHGAIYYHPQIGAFRVYGAIYQKYLQLGAEAGFLGYPTTDETGASDNIGRYNHFQGGSIYWTSTTGAREVHGAIRAKWASMGWENSYLGYPTSDEEDWIDPSDQAPGRISHFQRGTIVFWWTTGNAADLPDIAADAAYWQEPISPDSTGPWLASVQVVGYPEPNGRRFALAGSNCQPGNPQRKVRLRVKNRPSWVSQATFLYETEFVVYPNGAFDLSTQIFIPSTAGKLYFAVRDAVGQHPLVDRRAEITRWAQRAMANVGISEQVSARAQALSEMGFGALDAAHVASAEAAACDCLLTCDDRLLRAARRVQLPVRVQNPVQYLEEQTHG